MLTRINIPTTIMNDSQFTYNVMMKPTILFSDSIFSFRKYSMSDYFYIRGNIIGSIQERLFPLRIVISNIQDYIWAFGSYVELKKRFENAN